MISAIKIYKPEAEAKHPGICGDHLTEYTIYSCPENVASDCVWPISHWKIEDDKYHKIICFYCRLWCLLKKDFILTFYFKIYKILPFSFSSYSNKNKCYSLARGINYKLGI